MKLAVLIHVTCKSRSIRKRNHFGTTCFSTNRSIAITESVIGGWVIPVWVIDALVIRVLVIRVWVIDAWVISVWVIRVWVIGE